MSPTRTTCYLRDKLKKPFKLSSAQICKAVFLLFFHSFCLQITSFATRDIQSKVRAYSGSQTTWSLLVRDNSVFRISHCFAIALCIANYSETLKHSKPSIDIFLGVLKSQLTDFEATGSRLIR